LNFAQYTPSFFKLTTLDAKYLEPIDTCTSFDVAAFRNNLLYFVLWWTSHSGLARSKVKKALGIDEHPIERPLFAAVATIVWFLNIHNWIPISNCYKFDILKVSSLHWLGIGPILLFATVLIVGLVFNILYIFEF